MGEEIEFFDVKSKDKFKTTDYKFVNKGGRFFAVTKSPTGSYNCWKVVAKAFVEENSDVEVETQ